MEKEDPLVQALPPATDYLTYLTLLEYQLTPQRLPLLHRLLQDEKLTTNIGWDLVKLLLPMLPASTECLQDVARLGNPREVILRVCEALEHLQPGDEDSVDSEDTQREDREGKASLPIHVLQFNCLLAMLSVLHQRLQAKRPSRFVATSLKAALEAYETMTCDETTLALLEFFRDLTPNKRPAPPPRAPSESSVVRVAEASAPDPEAEVQSPALAKDTEADLVRKFVQFGLLEMLKLYLLSFSSPMDPGMAWTVRMQEKLNSELRVPAQSQTDAYATIEELRERDMMMGRINSLSRDLGIDSNELLSIVARSPENHAPPLDFDEPPEKVNDIHLERHGSLLLLAARGAGATLYKGTTKSMPALPVFPDLAGIFTNFLGKNENLEEVAFGQPQALLDSLLALTVHSTQAEIATPSSDVEFTKLLTVLTACTARQSHGIVRQIPARIFHSHPSPITRFQIVRQILEDKRYLSIRDSAISWLKEEMLGTKLSESEENIFHDALWFWSIFPLLLQPVHAEETTAAENLVASWSRLTQTEGPSLHSALNLYFLLLSSEDLRQRLQLEKTVKYFRSQVLSPLRQVFRAFENDLQAKGGDGLIEAAVGTDTCQAGLTRSAGLMGLSLDQIEELINEHYGTDDSDLQGYTDEEEASVEEIRNKTNKLVL
ncbi:Uncharacterized protein PECH_005443 [Penicillium ucsense]|uniref:YAP-binding/ALF4/Glomulin n=1 Tax=Penicillium ucsense TaxID=2839758 RepID=A0A8J8W1P0_9EURO|nr:Uncharacterized protein PECM_005981 [Penicillium ucsense]KAF7736342.1 Uncharacterized protein PECH_005443 [Penicillium ucsense]